MSTGEGGYFSLLWPCERQVRAVSDQTWTDLGLDRILLALSEGTKPNEAIDAILHQLPVDRTTIAYRLAITEDLLAMPALGDTFLSLPPMVGRLRYFALRPDQNDWTPLQEVTWRIRELEHYVGLLDMLNDGFASAGPSLSSAGLLALRAIVTRARTSAIFDRIRAELPALLRAAADFRSIAVGVNLGGGLEPVEATILDIGTTPYRGGGLAGRLLNGSDHTGIAQLHTAHSAEYAANPLLVPLFKDLSEILKRAVRPLARALSEFAGLSSRNFAALGVEVSFYAGAVRLARRLHGAGLPICSPQLREVGLSGPSPSDGDADEGRASCPPGVAGREAGLPAIEARGLYNIHLAIGRIEAASSTAPSKSVVGSDIALGGGESVAIVTGPNGGGKTTFLQSVGLAQLLSQLGLFAPASEMTLDPEIAWPPISPLSNKWTMGMVALPRRLPDSTSFSRW